MKFSRRTLLNACTLSGLASLTQPRWALADDKQKAEFSFTNWSKNPKNLKPTDETLVNSFNNYYEFGTSKSDPKENAQGFETTPWEITVDGLVDHPQTFTMEQIKSLFKIEQRLYRFRCVEAWSMVIPWDGFALRHLLTLCKPQASAKYVAFHSVRRRSEMIGQDQGVFGIEWPYREGLRLDEAQNDLTLLAIGSSGKALTPQCGAPIRLVVPWKYGFKSAKAITKITLTDSMPETTWNMMAPEEYGFYANINPDVDHPRWSQASERVIGSSSLFGTKSQKTLPFNGYGPEVADMYKNMDLAKWI